MSTSGERDMCENRSRLEELSAFVNETDDWIDQTLTTLGWTREHVMKSADLIECPVNPGHSVMPQSLDRHLKYCPLTSKGYTKNEIDAEQSSKFCYANSPLVVSIDLDETVLRNILETTGAAVPLELPATMTRAQTSLSCAMRRRIYDYCVEVAGSTSTSSRIADEELTLLEDTRSDKPMSKLEMMAKMRDMKRRRQSYRGKNTHTANKNYTEVIRDVLSSQMELLGNIWAEEAKELEEKKRREARERRAKDSATERHSTRRSHSRSRERSRDRRGSKSKESGRRSRHRDDSEENRHRCDNSEANRHRRDNSEVNPHRRNDSKEHRRRHDGSEENQHRRDDSENRQLRDDSEENRHRHDGSEESQRHRDDSGENRHRRSSSRKRKHSRSRSRSRSHRKHKQSRHQSPQARDESTRSVKTEIADDGNY